MITTPPPPLLLLLHFFSSISLLISSISALNSDATFLLSFKHSLLSHPSLLHNWNHTDPTPCSWTGVTCAPQTNSVITLHLPNSQLHGSIPNDLGRLHHLRSLDLSNNFINGTLPTSLFNCSNLQTLSLSSNLISGELPEFVSRLQSLRFLNLSDNGFSGGVPGGFDSVEVLDLSSNMFNGGLPLDFGGWRLKYLNLSNNKLSGSVFPQFAENIPATAVVDLSFNNFTGQIPETLSFSNQKTENFEGNLDLCGKPLKKMCIVPSSLSIQPNVSSAAIAVIPKPAGKSNEHGGRKVKAGKIAAIVVGDVAAMVVLAVLFFYTCQFLKKKRNQTPSAKPKEIRALITTCFNGVTGEETSESESESDKSNPMAEENDEEKKNCLVMVDGETELEMETLLKASAYVLGSSGESIVYKVVVGGGGGGGGVAFAVRRIGESRVEKMREFEKIVRVMGKFQHPNLVRVRGFYWGEEEKLVIYDYVVNGSLAAAAYKNVGLPSSHLSFEVRLKIAKGIAKGLLYIHEKKHVHGNIKPSNILLTSEMDPIISDFGLEWLKSGKSTFVTYKSTGNFDKKRSTSSCKFINAFAFPPTGLHGCMSPYQAPESMTISKPSPKWDVYSFGIILLELLLGKAFSNNELDQGNSKSSIIDNESKILKIIDEFITINEHDKKGSIITCFKLGFRCASLAPQKRPSMKETLQVLEKIPPPS
ncbi:hypothetical protein L6452_01056 [Arctium lappa]|uniref:Uncharacterized protein n=1 Tax=Arctium lappa TaxID=4217 RepID=A0ACB9FG23_ARCLA|nr:hypothetical protein L6452_01056 [Arctium lappa]